MKINQFLSNITTKAIQRKKQQQFGFLIAAIALIILFFSLKKTNFTALNEKSIWLVVITSLSILTSLLKPKLWLPLLWLWFLIGDFLGLIMSYVLLAIVYFFVFSPVSCIVNLFAKNRYKASWHEANDKINYEDLK